MTIRTRFAPSPTGFLHIGGVRTALFNWLLARQAGGQFILRIDDTDSKRNVEETLQPILDGFRWLGMDWDEGPVVGGPHAPYLQSERLGNYQSAAKRLLESGKAYRDYSRPEEFAAEREAAEKEKRDFVYSRTWMAEADEQAAKFESEGRSFVVRLKMPRAGKCEFHDLVRGDISFDWARESDHVIQRADGTCLYHLANVVDDHDFEITHIVRAVEHLSNTPRQIFILQSLGYELPKYAHIPFVAEPGSKNKLSKRKIEKYLNNKDFKRLYQAGATIAQRIGLPTDPDSFSPVLVNFYRDIGFLPDAIMNYLVLLGWSLDDKTEEFSRSQMLEHFSLDRIVKSEASFDSQKLMAVQSRYMNDLPLKRKTEMCLGFLKKSGLVPDLIASSELAYVEQIVAAAGDRICMAGDILKFETFFLADEEIEFDDKPFQKRLIKPENAGFLLSEFVKLLATVPNYVSTELEETLHGFCETQGIGPGDIIHALRVAVTGQAAGFGMFDTLEILGRERCLNRIKLALSKLNEQRTNNAV